MLWIYSRFAAFFLLPVLLQIKTCTATTGLYYETEQVYQFPNTTFVENLAVRPGGSILTTIANRAEVYLIRPSAKDAQPQLIYRFNGSNVVTGIAETSPDTFYLTVTSVSESLGPIANSSQLWKITFPTRKSDNPFVTKVSSLRRILLPNGLTTLSSGKRLLSADSSLGYVFIIDTATGNTIAAMFDPLFDPVGPGSFGVNGLEVRDSTLYFTNSAQKVFGKIPIDPRTGSSLGSAAAIAKPLSPAGGYDDFALSPSGDAAFMATGAANGIEKIDLESGRQEFVVGGLNSTVLNRPTSAAFARSGNGKVDLRVFFVTTAGGQLVKVTIRSNRETET
ncbi:MAG: hypothetical protein Q9223_000435 [Gallowayella weberi]